MSQLTLRISIHESAEAAVIKLEGRIAGLWIDELRQTWQESAPLLSERKLIIDLCDVTYADQSGIQVLRDMFSQKSAEFVTSTPWTQYLAEVIAAKNADRLDQEP
jgi:anti-anti-sigma regulatory factor